MDLVKLMVIGEPERIRKILVEGHKTFDANQVELTESEPEYLEFLPAHVSKGQALDRLSRYLGIEQHNVMAIGDYLNDVEMISWAGYGVAMGNAMAEVKAVAQAVTTTNNEGGVARAIAIVLQ
jgi:Cof subfamily protein (haloacid dehalogenase superfamily)